MLIEALAISPSMACLTLVTVKVENVVYEAKNPTAINNLKCEPSSNLDSERDINTPRTNEPDALIAKVVQKVGPAIVLNKRSKPYLDKAPKAPPIATKINVIRL